MVMTELLDLALQAHGGIERWRTFDTVRATFVSSGWTSTLEGTRRHAGTIGSRRDNAARRVCASTAIAGPPGA